jgi:hypothetical protein
MTDTPAWDAWAGLTDAERKEVGRLADMGQRHPDPRVAAAAEGWARVILEVAEAEKADRRTVGGFVFAAIEFFIEFLTNSPGVDNRVSNRSARRWARRVLAAR